MDSAELATRARRAYERGRWRMALQIAPLVAVLVALSFVAAGGSTLTALAGAALLATATVLRWRGGALGAGVRAGLAAGLVPFTLLLVLKCSAHTMCAVGMCMSHCTPFCGIGGLVAGVLIAVRARRHADHLVAFLAAGSAIAALTGLLGCFVGGVTGIAWMLAGELAATLPAFAVELRRR